MNLELTEAALEDLRSIREYTLQRWGKQQEQAYIDRLWYRFGELLKDSSRCRFRSDLFPGCQLAAEGKHVILFRITADVLQIVRVLHSAMDFKRQSEAHPPLPASAFPWRALRPWREPAFCPDYRAKHAKRAKKENTMMGT